MPQGAFVLQRDTEVPRFFDIRTRAGIDAPEDQLTLAMEIDRTRFQLDQLYPHSTEGNAEAKRQIGALFGIASLGLVGDHAQPAVASRALQNLKDEVLLREAGRVKNNYMGKLGYTAFALGLIALYCWCIALIFDLTGNDPGGERGWSKPWQTFALLWMGCMAGVWISFGARKTIFRFEDLTLLEADRVEPALRLMFAGIITSGMGAAFYIRMVEVNVGNVSTAHLALPENPMLALFLGFVFGFSELMLPQEFSKQAKMFFSQK